MTLNQGTPYLKYSQNGFPGCAKIIAGRFIKAGRRILKSRSGGSEFSLGRCQNNSNPGSKFGPSWINFRPRLWNFCWPPGAFHFSVLKNFPGSKTRVPHGIPGSPQDTKINTKTWFSFKNGARPRVGKLSSSSSSKTYQNRCYAVAWGMVEGLLVGTLRDRFSTPRSLDWWSFSLRARQPKKLWPVRVEIFQ